MRTLNEYSPLVNAVALQILLERDRCMRECDEALALRFVDRVKRSSRELAPPVLESAP